MESTGLMAGSQIGSGGTYAGTDAQRVKEPPRLTSMLDTMQRLNIRADKIANRIRHKCNSLEGVPPAPTVGDANQAMKVDQVGSVCLEVFSDAQARMAAILDDIEGQINRLDTFV